ncbi:piggyBac transposable element-derived protein 4-like [Osmia bicornis bicornis]|uniref:piggyBac transposable element-derived protein 4-like n=1 Tax=Osmia bicornis bicornis TaxID=1437191 RepID=UPI001EAF03A3|nr:piggyBac transposable element-derived protein 4-like [Osmia bicornis bicornis]
MTTNNRKRLIDENNNYSDLSEGDEINSNLAREKPHRNSKRFREMRSRTSEYGEDGSSKSEKDLTDIRWASDLFRSTFHKFNSQHSGIKASIRYSAWILDYFQLFCSEDFINFIVGTTNSYCSSLDKNYNTINLQNTSLPEMYCFPALKLLMSRNKKLKYSEYWSNDKLLRSNIFGEVMSRDRFLYLLKILHFNTNIVTADVDKLYKIRESCDKLRQRFQEAFYPFQILCIDESLLLYKGRLSFKQYIPSKRNRFGIKSFVLCDTKSGFVQDFIIYNGSLTTVNCVNEFIGKSGNIVMELLKPYLGKGHTLYVDNWYTSPTLFILLHHNRTNACGTVRKRRKGMPVIQNKLKTGEVSFRSSKYLLAMRWCDKREVYMLSSFHSEEFVETKRHYRTREMIMQPKCVFDYNKLMGAVDKTDMVISTIHSERKALKWYKKYFFHLIDICIWNAYCLYKLKTGKQISMASFHLELIRQLLSRYQSDSKNTIANKSGKTNPLRLAENHFPSLYTIENPRGKNQMRVCVVCSRNDKRRRSRYQCEICNVGLCVTPCFKKYHTQLSY